MNRVILMGRLVRDPEVRYSQGEKPVAIARYTLAVSRRFRRDGEPEADFITCVAMGKSGEFVEKFLRKGQLISIVGRLQVRSWDDKDGTKRWSTDVVVEEHYFTESKASQSNTQSPAPQPVAQTNAQQKSADFDATIEMYGLKDFVEDDEEMDDLPF